jgi:hypothetical protein
VTVVCSGMKAQPFQVAVNTSPQDGQAWLLVSWPGIHAPSNLLPQPGQSSGECSVILIPGRSSPLPAGRGPAWQRRPYPAGLSSGFRFPLRCWSLGMHDVKASYWRTADKSPRANAGQRAPY